MSPSVTSLITECGSNASVFSLRDDLDSVASVPQQGSIALKLEALDLTHNVRQSSPSSALNHPRQNLFGINLSLPVQCYIGNADHLEEVLAYPPSASESLTEESIRNRAQLRMQRLLDKYDRVFGRWSQESRNLLDGVDAPFKNQSQKSKDEQINAFIPSAEQERVIPSYYARIPLPSGENAPWDMRTGEQRTAPRRGPRQTANRRQTNQTPRLSTSSPTNRDVTPTATGHPVLTRIQRPPLQQPQHFGPYSTHMNLDEGNNSGLSGIATTSTSSRSVIPDSSSVNAQNNTLGDIQGDGMASIISANTSPVTASAEAFRSRQMANVSGAMLPAPSLSLNQGQPETLIGQPGPSSLRNSVPQNTTTERIADPAIVKGRGRGRWVNTGAAATQTTGRIALTPSDTIVPGLSPDSSDSQEIDSSPSPEHARVSLTIARKQQAERPVYRSEDESWMGLVEDHVWE